MLRGVQSRLAEMNSEAWSDKKAGEAIMKLALPEELKELALKTALGIKEKFPDTTLTAMTSTGKRKRVHDIITQGIRSRAKQTRTCTNCGEASSIFPNDQDGSEWDLCRRRSCICGGDWWAD